MSRAEMEKWLFVYLKNDKGPKLVTHLQISFPEGIAAEFTLTEDTENGPA